MAILITGGSGYIGSALTRRLAKRGEIIHVLCRPNAEISHLCSPNIKIYYGYIEDPAAVWSAMNGCDRVYHLAALAANWAPNFQRFYQINVDGTKNVFTAAKSLSVTKIVFTSTCLTFGNSNGVPLDESHLRPSYILTPYARSKAMAEQLIQQLNEDRIEIVTVHPTRVFGPGLLTEGNATTQMICQYLEGKWHYILGNGQAVGNYGYLPDIVDGFIQAMARGRHGESYLLGGENISFNEFFSVINTVGDYRFPLFRIPKSLITIFSHLEILRARLFYSYPLISPEWVKLFSKDGAFCCTKAQTDLDYHITPFREAIRQTIEWIIKNKESQDERDILS
ncbi:MAG: NAD-dependent epimerase/dehydratase family protein [Calditrichales bacterium]|nr:MAG: NAD-dependent epimerase/dehydratase family protein [Calditrichales bacterium]